jgi:hypothetical protein
MAATMAPVAAVVLQQMVGLTAPVVLAVLGYLTT